MDELLKKISSYNLLNNLLPGAILCFVIRHFIGFGLPSDNIINKLFIYYFFGTIINRVGSILVENIYRKIKPDAFAKYSEYIEASKIDKKIDVLSETNNMYRTFLSLLIVIACVKVYFHIIEHTTMFAKVVPYIVGAILIVIFTLSYGKQTKRIKERVETTLKKKD